MSTEANTSIAPVAQYLHGCLADARAHAISVAKKCRIEMRITESWKRSGHQRYRVVCPQHVVHASEVTIETYIAGTGALKKQSTPYEARPKSWTFPLTMSVARREIARCKGQRKARDARKFTIALDVLGDQSISADDLRTMVQNAVAGHAHQKGCEARVTWIDIQQKEQS